MEEKLQEQELKLYKMRHSMSHILAKAVTELYGKEVKLAIGPPIDNGFYYDFDMPVSLNENDFEKIENKMRELINKNDDFVKAEMPKEQALEMFKDQPYKLELINELEDGQISVYYTGDFVDLCKGPHVENTKYLRGFAFKIARVSGAYWRGSEKNKMLQRVYVYGFEKNDELKEYLRMLEEAAKRDHRKLGKELGLFFFSDYAPGSPFFEPKGMLLKSELIKFWREKHLEAGYVEIETPITLNRKLWEISGHWLNYKDNMYSFKIEEEDFAIKPMNCPGGILYYQERLHSYKDFPLRVGELGKVHRHESSGTLHGLFRVRSFTQDDAHIFMLPSQISSEVKNVLDLVDDMYSTFGLSYHLELSTMPEKHIGDIKDWEIAEDALKQALKNLGKDYIINEGDGAFYGPKIDIHIKDAIGRTWQCGTIQLDMQLPKRFEIEYIDENNERREPIMIHRVIYGSIERFLGIITEHFAGAFPTWLAPVQVSILPISEKNNDYANKVKEQLQVAGIRVVVDDRNEKIGKKIREAQLQKIPYMLIVGMEEEENNTISVRNRVQGDKGSFAVEEFKNMIVKEIEDKVLNNQPKN